MGAMDAFAKGWSIQESVYEPDGDHIWLRSVRAKNPAHFGLDLNAFGRIESLTLRLPGETAVLLPRDKFVIFQHRQTYGNAKGTSDLDAAHKHWAAKQTLLGAWRLHLERFAMPTVLAKFARGLPAEEQSALMGSLDNLHKVTSMLYPDEIELTTLGGTREPSTGFMEALDFHNREIARAILGQTLTTDEGRRVGSLAMGKVHLQVLLLQLEALRKDLADRVMTEQVIRPLVELNFGPGAPPRFVFEPTSVGAFVTGELD
jgi:phage gp29-like protein